MSFSSIQSIQDDRRNDYYFSKYWNAATQFFKNKQFNSAVTALKKADEFTSSFISTDITAISSIVYLASNQYDLALKQINAAINRSINRHTKSIYYIYRGIIKLKMGDYYGASDDFDDIKIYYDKHSKRNKIKRDKINLICQKAIAKNSIHELKAALALVNKKLYDKNFIARFNTYFNEKPFIYYALRSLILFSLSKIDNKENEEYYRLHACSDIKHAINDEYPGNATYLDVFYIIYTYNNLHHEFSNNEKLKSKKLDQIIQKSHGKLTMEQAYYYLNCSSGTRSLLYYLDKKQHKGNRAIQLNNELKPLPTQTYDLINSFVIGCSPSDAHEIQKIAYNRIHKKLPLGMKIKDSISNLFHSKNNSEKKPSTEKLSTRHKNIKKQLNPNLPETPITIDKQNIINESPLQNNRRQFGEDLNELALLLQDECKTEDLVKSIMFFSSTLCDKDASINDIKNASDQLDVARKKYKIMLDPSAKIVFKNSENRQIKDIQAKLHLR